MNLKPVSHTVFCLSLIGATLAVSCGDFKVEKAGPVNTTRAADPTDLTAIPSFNKVFSRIFAAESSGKCSTCHSASSKAGGIDLSTYAAITRPELIKAGDPDHSPLYQAILSSAGAMQMPFSLPPLPDADRALLASWIQAGALQDASDPTAATPASSPSPSPSASSSAAPFSPPAGPGPDPTVSASPSPGPSPSPSASASPSAGGGPVILSPTAISYADKIKPLIEGRCLTCHSAALAMDGVDLSSLDKILAQPEIVSPLKSAESKLYNVLISTDPSARMPLGGNPFTSDESDLVKKWIDQGAKP